MSKSNDTVPCLNTAHVLCLPYGISVRHSAAAASSGEIVAGGAAADADCCLDNGDGEEADSDDGAD